MKIIDDTKRALREVVRLLEDAHGPMVALEIMRSAELTLGTQANRLINALYDKHRRFPLRGKPVSCQNCGRETLEIWRTVTEVWNLLPGPRAVLHYTSGPSRTEVHCASCNKVDLLWYAALKEVEFADRIQVVAKPEPQTFYWFCATEKPEDYVGRFTLVQTLDSCCLPDAPEGTLDVAVIHEDGLRPSTDLVGKWIRVQLPNTPVAFRVRRIPKEELTVGEQARTFVLADVADAFDGPEDMFKDGLIDSAVPSEYSLEDMQYNAVSVDCDGKVIFSVSGRVVEA